MSITNFAHWILPNPRPWLNFTLKGGSAASPPQPFGAEQSDLRGLHPTVVELQAIIEDDPEIWVLLHKAFEQIPTTKSPQLDPLGRQLIHDYPSLLRALDAALKTPPSYPGPGKILMGLPFGSVLNALMGTVSGAAFFLNTKVTQQFDRILSAWAEFLTTEASTIVLNDSDKGWFGHTAHSVMLRDGETRFEDEFECDPTRPHYGYVSWDTFFTRSFRPGRRPIAAPDDDAVIVNACESAPFRLAREVRLRDSFWLKSPQPYSLRHMLASDEATDQFVGGTIYQAFLSSETYHRWHSPVAGRVVRVRVIPGTCFSKAVDHSASAAAATGQVMFDATDPMESQAYITAVSSRALIFIQADNKDIGLMCVMPVGMGECASCDVWVKEGQRLEKGQQLGTFHFGGSTHCLFFRPGVRLDFDLRGQQPGPKASIIPINSRIATVINE
ncbi:MAG: hypothetical protein M1820_007786 [Bogoriella megaspora]|nr:MAG: hypothetical protein M1820_007786 [Bogoriella megaspora]